MSKSENVEQPIVFKASITLFENPEAIPSEDDVSMALIDGLVRRGYMDIASVNTEVLA